MYLTTIRPFAILLAKKLPQWNEERTSENSNLLFIKLSTGVPYSTTNLSDLLRSTFLREMGIDVTVRSFRQIQKTIAKELILPGERQQHLIEIQAGMFNPHLDTQHLTKFIRALSAS